jgi:hypothetical protein
LLPALLDRLDPTDPALPFVCVALAMLLGSAPGCAVPAVRETIVAFILGKETTTSFTTKMHMLALYAMIVECVPTTRKIIEGTIDLLEDIPEIGADASALRPLVNVIVDEKTRVPPLQAKFGARDFVPTSAKRTWASGTSCRRSEAHWRSPSRPGCVPRTTRGKAAAKRERKFSRVC